MKLIMMIDYTTTVRGDLVSKLVSMYGWKTGVIVGMHEEQTFIYSLTKVGSCAIATTSNPISNPARLNEWMSILYNKPLGSYFGEKNPSLIEIRSHRP